MLASLRSTQWRYLTKEAVLFLLLTYLTLFGATFNGIIELPLIQANLILIAAIGGIWLVWRLARRRAFPTTSLEIPWLLLIAAYSLATAFSTDPRRSALVLIRLLIYVLVFYLVVDLLRAGWTAGLFLKALIFTSIFMILFNLLEVGLWYAAWIQTAGWANFIPPQLVRISAFLKHGNYVAAYFNLLLPLIATQWLQARPGGSRRGWLVWYLLALVTMVFTLSRGGWIGAMAGRYVCLALLAFSQRERLLGWWRAGRGRWKVSALAASALILMTLLDLGVIYLQTNHPSHVAGAASALPGQLPDVSANRGYIWNVALGMLKDHPIFGNGPFTFGTRFIQSTSIPPGMLLAHAHNFVLQVAGETGLVGLAALLVLVAGFSSVVIRRWRSSQGEARLTLIGVLAALAGFGVHSLFDTPEQLPVFCLFAVILGAVLAAENEPAGKRVPTLLASAPFILAWAGAAACFAWYLWSYQPFTQGVEASFHTDWPAAAQKLDTAAQRDPLLAFNWLQAGFAHGELALAADGSAANRAELTLALADYRRGLALEPTNATNWGNYAALQWAGGDQDGAIAAIQKAADAANRQPIFRLTLGRMLEASGKQERAAQEYIKVLSLSPDWSESYFFRATPFRQQLARSWKEQNASLLESLQAAHLEGQASEQELRAAVSLSEDAAVIVQDQLALASLYRQKGQTAQAMRTYESAFSQLNASSSLGIGQLGNPQYGWFIFDRQSIAADLLPGVDMILYTDPIIADMLDLAGLYEKAGRSTDASRLYQKVLTIAPDSQASRERLARLSP